MHDSDPRPLTGEDTALPWTDSPIARTLGLRLVNADPAAGTAEVAFRVGEEFTNIHGTVQGGILIAMLDATMGPTLRATLPAETEAPTLDIATHFLAPAGAGGFHRTRTPAPQGPRHRVPGRGSAGRVRRRGRDGDRDVQDPLHPRLTAGLTEQTRRTRLEGRCASPHPRTSCVGRRT